MRQTDGSINKTLSEADVCPWSQQGLDLRLTQEKMTVGKLILWNNLVSELSYYLPSAYDSNA